ncbi:hypothetical protein AVEN_245834-1 [Araneus ventricosus]|uniref:Uncharacterized protein n=1 Tax=Araneus ventricosus TaxID=182803 RepID=A0A4Y2EAV7_ARAVE|nr:hypothetical protein AVEN_245834-1 [Araneus ventricosus]
MGRGGLVVGISFWTGGLQARNPIPLKIRRVWDLLHSKSHAVPNVLPLVWSGSLERVTGQVSSSSSDRGLNLRGPSQTSPRVASEGTLICRYTTYLIF